MAHEALLSRLRAPMTLEEFSQGLEQVESLVREQGAAFWQAEATRPFEETFLASLLMKMRFYALMLSAQHLLIRELRGELGRDDAVPAVAAAGGSQVSVPALTQGGRND